MIFSPIDRSDASAQLSSESEFQFLDRSSRPEIGIVRCLLEDLVAQYPSDERIELIKRIQSGNDTNFNSAVFELILYSALTKLGYNLQPHPILSNGSTKRPDFLVTTQDGSQFYLEAVLASHENGSHYGKQKMIQTTLDAFQKERHEKFKVDFKYTGFPTTQPSKKDLISCVHKWLDSLDPDNEDVKSKMLLWSHEGLQLRMRPRPISPGNRGKLKSLRGISSRGVSMVDSTSAIRKSITSKGNRYGELDKPYLIAVNFNSPFLDQEDEEQALFGDEAFTFSCDDSEPFELNRLPNGAWIGRTGPRYTRISGVWIFNDLSAYTIARRRSTVYFNPWAKKALPAELKKFPHAEVQNDTLTRLEGVSIRDIFTLPPEWPESNP